MTESEKELREKIAEIAEFVCEGHCEPCRYYNGKPIVQDAEFCTETPKANQILSLIDQFFPKLAKERGYVQLSEDQSLPSSGEVVLLDPETFESGYHLGQLRMIETHFRRIKVD